ncbi:GNAT family N-acetyltransferase [Aspergillus homomorphus CBS 101889]|uniref:N-acetyltransferase domain-containing protein n=1 Tax=Aspergillus homomorphus (strain CBS 101889) TaxID=1450537 RepID=A0A395HKE8_ASPHC|nr:hypothetical protein BO97DRAFT_408808 [Aspergillus homomorphus CBS 101889]RAL07685.1 hypothetical protein BO97DRAFT_408808 [Aspergillus homomorphus CBS 101889]
MSLPSDAPPPALPPHYHLHIGYPPIEEYLHLRAASGLTPKTAAQGTAAVQGSWFGCYVTYDGDCREEQAAGNSPPALTTGQPTTISPSTPTPTAPAVAMGRIIGDGGWYFHIADMAVLPEHQRKGLGQAILQTLLARIREAAPAGDPYVNLLADAPGRRLYRKNGFLESAPKEMGMGFVMVRGGDR